MAANGRTSQVVGEVLDIPNTAAARASQVVGEVLDIKTTAKARTSQLVAEVLVHFTHPTCTIAVPVYGSIAANYYCILKDTTGTRMHTFDRWINLEYMNEIGGVGYYIFTIDGNDMRKLSFTTDAIFEVWRSIPGLGVPWYKAFEGFHRTPNRKTSSKGQKTFTSMGVGFNDLLYRTDIAYKSGTIMSTKSAPAETVMKAYVQENCGTLATVSNLRQSDGVLPGFTVEADTGAGDVWSGDRSGANLLEVLQEIMNAKHIDFKVVAGPTPATFIFKTFANQLGTDRTNTSIDANSGMNAAGNAPVKMSIEFANIREIEYEANRSAEINVVHVLGKGEGSLRDWATVYSTAKNDSPWNRREVARPSTNQEFMYQLEDYGHTVLAENAMKETFRFNPLQQPSCAFGKHYVTGDRLTVIMEEIVRNKRIMSDKVSIANKDETIELNFADVK